jgi:hypothetical protein
MKLLMIFVDRAHADEVRDLLETMDVAGYSRFPNVTGKGLTGHKLGTRAFPGSSELFVTALGENRCDALVTRLERLKSERSEDEGLKVYCLNTEELL